MGRIDDEAKRLSREAEQVVTRAGAANAAEARRQVEEQGERESEIAQQRADSERMASDLMASIVSSAQIYSLLTEMRDKHWRCGKIEAESLGGYSDPTILHPTTTTTTIRLFHSYPGWASVQSREDIYFTDSIEVTVRLRSDGQHELEAESHFGGRNYIHDESIRLSRPRMAFTDTTPASSLVDFVVRALADDLNARRSSSLGMPRDIERKASARLANSKHQPEPDNGT